MNYRRINLFGGPGSGKSTLAAYIFCELKKKGIEIELVQEYVKKMVYDGTKRRPYDQLKILSRQVEREESILVNNPKSIIVTDCPIAMTIPYAIEMKFPEVESLMKLAKAFDKDYPPMNFYLIRGDYKYSAESRYQKTLEEAKKIDEQILKLLENFSFLYIEPGRESHKNVVGVVLDSLNWKNIVLDY